MSRQGSPAHVPQLIAPWSDYEFAGSASSGPIRGKVTKISDTNGIFTSEHLPIRIFLSSHGTDGDSGALVIDTASGHPIGLYMGGYADPAGGTGGIAQHLFQATSIMDMEVYL
jgi:hypothetical protein